MARKKKKDNLAEGLTGLLILGSAITFVYTQSLPATVTVFVASFIGMLALVKMIQSK